MKNKKLIATVASLCLVLVAVVAAVIGVLAAAQQNATAKLKVTYVATNVKAEVSVNSRTQYGSWAADEQDQTSFNAGDEQRDGSGQDVLSVDQIALAWESTGANSGKLNYYAVYRFTFKNTSSNNDMKVNLTYTAPSTSSNDDNVTLFWFSGTDSNPTFTPSYESDHTTLSTVTASAAEQKTCIAKPLSGATEMLDVAKNGNSGYVYLVVAVSSVESNATYDLTADGSILFNLVAQAN